MPHTAAILELLRYTIKQLLRDFLLTTFNIFCIEGIYTSKSLCNTRI